MFQAKHSAGSVYLIYAVQEIENGITQFLIYHLGMKTWVWWPASEFKPV